MSILEGSLAALQTGQQVFADQYTKNRQRQGLKISREQQDNANEQQALIRRKDDARTLVGGINAHFGSMGKEWNKTDGLALLEDPQAKQFAISMLNDSAMEKYREFTNEKDQRVGANIVDVIKNEDGSYTPMVKRSDTGEIVVMTEGRNADPMGNATKIDPTTMSGVLNSRYQAAVNDGGLESTGSFLASAAAITANMAKQDALDLAVTKIDDQAQLSQFGLQINSIDIEAPGAMKALLDVFKSLGGDADALVAKGQARSDELFLKEVEEGGGYPAGSLAERLVDNGVTREKWNGLTPEEKATVSERLSDGQSLGQLWDKTAGVIAAGTEDAVSAPFKAAGQVWDAFKISFIGRKLGLSELTDMPADSPNYFAANEANDEEIAAGRKDITQGRVDVMLNGQPASAQSTGGRTPKGTDVGGPASTTPDPVISPPSFTLTAENVQKAILEQTETPSEKQIATMDKFLKDRGIDNEAALAKAIEAGEINAQEGQMLAWVMGATAKGDTAVKAGVAQGISNLLNNGDQEVGTLQATQIRSAEAQGQAATRNAQTKLQDLQLKLQQYDMAAVGPMIESGDPVLLKMYQELGMIDKESTTLADATWTDTPFSGDEDDAVIISRLISGFIPKLKNAQGGVSAAAGMDIINPMLSLYLQSKANADPGGLFDGETYKDFFRKDADGTIDFDLNNVRVGKTKNGKPTSIVYVDQEGVRSEALKVEDLQEDSKVIARLLITAAQKNGTAAEYTK